MRKLVFIMIALVLITGIFVVDERQVAVITSYNGHQVTKPVGIHFAWPVLEKVTYVFMNQRSSLLTLTVNESEVSPSPLQVEVLISYHVINPIDYLAAVHKLGKVGISEQMANTLIGDVVNKIKTDTLIKFNQESVIFSNLNEFRPVGVNIDQVILLNLKFIPLAK